MYRRRASNFGASIFGRPCWRGMRGVVRVTPWAWVCSWMPALTGDAAGCRAGGLAAALGDAGFGTPARRGSLPSPALGVSMVLATGRRVPQLGDGSLPGSRDRAVDAPAWGGLGRPLAVLGQMGRAR